MINILSQIDRFSNDVKFVEGQEFNLVLPKEGKQHNNKKSSNTLDVGISYRIKVKEYMTKQSTTSFDFMLKFNNNNPMPLRVMSGEVIKETRGMVYMKLCGEAQKTVICMRCGRTLTNPVSMVYGIGPECASKVGISLDVTDEDIEHIKSQINELHWEGWVIKSAITEFEEVER